MQDGSAIRKSSTPSGWRMTIKLINCAKRTLKMDCRIHILVCAEVVIHVLRFRNSRYISGFTGEVDQVLLFDSYGVLYEPFCVVWLLNNSTFEGFKVTLRSAYWSTKKRNSFGVEKIVRTIERLGMTWDVCELIEMPESLSGSTTKNENVLYLSRYCI